LIASIRLLEIRRTYFKAHSNEQALFSQAPDLQNAAALLLKLFLS